MFELNYPEFKHAVVPKNRETDPILTVVNKNETNESFKIDLKKLSASVETKSVHLTHVGGDTKIVINHKCLTSIFRTSSIMVGDGMYQALLAYANKNNAVRNA